MTNQLITHQLPIDYSLISLMSSISYILYVLYGTAEHTKMNVNKHRTKQTYERYTFQLLMSF